MANEPVSKLLSCDPRRALCTFVQLVCPALPCRFVSVVRASMQNRSGGSFEGARVNSFGRVVRVRARPGERARIKNDKLSPEVGFLHVRAARLPDYPLSIRFGRSRGTFEGARVKSFGRVIRAGRLRRPCELIRAGRSGKGVPRRTSPYQKC